MEWSKEMEVGRGGAVDMEVEGGGGGVNVEITRGGHPRTKEYRKIVERHPVGAEQVVAERDEIRSNKQRKLFDGEMRSSITEEEKEDFLNIRFGHLAAEKLAAFNQDYVADFLTNTVEKVKIQTSSPMDLSAGTPSTMPPEYANGEARKRKEPSESSARKSAESSEYLSKKGLLEQETQRDSSRIEMEGLMGKYLSKKGLLAQENQRDSSRIDLMLNFCLPSVLMVCRQNLLIQTPWIVLQTQPS